ncbi:MAG: hypothetical protein V4641_05625 [Pseudomonadota bacterium]
MAQNKQLKFYSPDGTDMRVCLPDGRTAIVGEEPRDLHPAFNRAAIRAGCLSTDMPSAVRMQGADVPLQDDVFKRKEAIKEKMSEALRAEEGAPGYEDAFTSSGIPNINWLSKAVGFNIERSERDELWSEVQAELDNDDEERDDENHGNVE